MPPSLIPCVLRNLTFLLFLLLSSVFAIPIVPTVRSAECPVLLPPLSAVTPRIVGGDKATPPSGVASIHHPFLGFTCTATLISPTYIVTAAHCGPTTRYFAFLGGTQSSQGTRVNFRRVVIHPDYNSFSGDDFDIALIELDEPAPSSFRPVKLNFDDDAPKDWSIVRAAGYGQQSFFQGFPSDDFFRFVDLPVVPSTICERQYRGVTDITNKILCAGYLKSATCSPCFGDSGGPLFAYDDDGFEVQVGVTSAGRGCGLPGSPGLFVKISAFEDWMKNEGALPEEGSINDSFVEGVDEDGVLSPEDSEDSTNSNSDAGSNIQGATGEEDSKVNGSEDSGDNDGSEDSGDDDDGDDEDDDSNRDPSLSRGGNAISTGAIVGIAVGAFVAVVIVVVAVVSIRTRLKRGNTSPDIPPTVQPPPAPLTLSEAAAAASAAAAEESTVDAVPETGRDVFGSDANVAPAVPAPHAQSGMS